MKHRVAIRKISSPGGTPLNWTSNHIRSLKTEIGDLMQLCDFDPVRFSGQNVLIHPNLVRPHQSRPASFTDPRLILAVADFIRESGARTISVGENPGFEFSARQAFREAGLTDELNRMGVNTDYFDEGSWIQVSNPKGRLYRNVMVARSAVECDLFVNMPKLKTHMLTQVSICIKNLLGIIHDDQRILFHRNDIADKVVDLNLVRYPDLNIVDGLWAMEGQAPFHGSGLPEFNVLVAGTSSAVVDAVCCRIMGFSVTEVPHVQLALKRLVDKWEPESLEIAGDDIQAIAHHFIRPVLSSMGQFDGVDCIECGVCNGCLSAVRHSLDWLSAEMDLKSLPSCTVVSGRPMPNTRTLEDWNGRLILMGNCAAEFQFFDSRRRQNALWIPGCPPHVLDLAKMLKNLIP